MASSRYADSNYDYDARGKVRVIDYDQLERIRNQEFNFSSSRDRDRNAGNNQQLVLSSSRRSRDLNDDNDAPPQRYQPRDNDGGYYQVARRNTQGQDARPRSLDYGSGSRSSNRRLALAKPSSSRRGRDASSPSDSEAESSSDSDSRSRRRRHHRHSRRERDKDSKKPQRARSAGDNNPNNKQDQDQDDEGRLWYSHKPRKEGSFLERNFDSSYDGIVAAIAGGLIGAMGARRLGGEEKQKAKILGAAAVGAASFNLVENKYRVYTEEREERKEEDWEEKWGKPNKGSRFMNMF